MRSLAAVPIGAPGAPLGALALAHPSPGAFAGAHRQMRLQVAAMSALRLLRQQQVEHLCEILAAVEGARDDLSAVSALLRAAPRFMLCATNMRMAVRLALVPDGLGEEQQQQQQQPLLQQPAAAAPTSRSSPRGLGPEALLFELPRAPRGASLELSARGGGGKGAAGTAAFCAAPAVVRPGDADGEVAASRLPLANTLLAAALRHRQARFVRECSAYMTSCPCPARDVFSRASELVAAVVVLPLFAPSPASADADTAAAAAADGADGGSGCGAPLGGLYFALDSPCDFDNLRDALLGFVHAAGGALARRLAGRFGALEAELARAPSEARPSAAPSSSTADASASDAPGRGGMGSGTGSGSGDSGCDRRGASRPLPPSPPSPAPSAGDADSPRGGASGAGAGACGGGGGSGALAPPPSSRLSQSGCSHSLLNTEAMLQVLQQEVRRGWRRGGGAGGGARGVPELTILERVASGGYGSVYRGLWHKNAAAVKVMHVRAGGADGNGNGDDDGGHMRSHHQAVSDAMEMAVLSSVQHPNVS